MADALRAGGAFVELAPKLAADFADAAAKQLEPATKSIGDKFASVAKGASVALAGGVVGGAVALFAAGSKIDEALDSIRIGTGKTGSSLAELDDSFRRVAATVPNSFKEVADTVSQLNQRTGLTGTNLDGLAQQLLTVSRITGTDLNGNIATASKLMENFGVPADQAGKKLDFLFRASQQSGVGFADLASQVTTAGPVMRQLGFSLEDTTSLIAQLNKQGIDSGPVMAGMKRALAEFAKAGEDPTATFKRMVTEIQNSKDPIVATQEAMKLFGTRGGAVMTEAIRSGRLNFEQFKDSIAGGKDTILGAAAATDDAAETFGKLKNQVMLAIEPLASRVFDTASVGVAKLAGGIKDFLSGFTKGTDEIGSAQSKWAQWGAVVYGVVQRTEAFLRPLVVDIQQFFHMLVTGFSYDEGTGIERFARSLRETVIPAFQALVAFVKDNLKPVLAGMAAALLVIVVPAFIAWAGSALAAAAAELAAIAPVVAVVAAIGLLVGALVYAYEHWTAFRDVVDAVVSWLTGTAWPALQVFWQGLQAVVSVVVDWLVKNAWPAIQTFVGWIIVAWQGLSAASAVVWNAIGAAIQWFVNGPVAFVQEQIAAFQAFINQHWDEISQITHAVWDALSLMFRIWWDVVSGIFTFEFAVLRALWEPFWVGLQAVVHVAFDVIKTVLEVWWDLAAGLFRAGRDTLAAIFGALLDLLTGHWSRAWDTIKQGVENVWGDIGGALEKAGRAAIGGLESLIGDFTKWGDRLGHSIIDAIVNAIKNAAGAVADAVKGVISDIPGASTVLKHIPGFATGGTTPAGWFLAGERGPELVHVNSPSAVINNADTMRTLGGGSAKVYQLSLGVVPGDPVDIAEQFRRMELLS